MNTTPELYAPPVKHRAFESAGKSCHHRLSASRGNPAPLGRKSVLCRSDLAAELPLLLAQERVELISSVILERLCVWLTRWCSIFARWPGR